MTLEIDRFNAHVEVAPSGGGTRPSGEQGSLIVTDANREAIKEALRPLVLEILDEEMEIYLRGRA